MNELESIALLFCFKYIFSSTSSFCQYFGTVCCRLRFWAYFPVQFSTQITLKSQLFGLPSMRLPWKVCGAYLEQHLCLDPPWILDVRKPKRLQCIRIRLTFRLISFNFRGIQKYIANASVSNVGPTNIRRLSYPSICDTFIIWQYASSFLHRWLQTGKHVFLAFWFCSHYCNHW